MIRVALAGETDWDGWRSATRALVLAGVPPRDVVWSVGGDPGDPLPAGSGSFGVSRTLVALAQMAIQARDPARFALLHRLVAGTDEAAMTLARRLALSVRAEAHRMRTHIRFMPLDGRHVGWYAPRHFVLEANARLLARRFPHLAVSVLTPDGGAHWQDSEPAFGPGADPPDDAALAALWRERGAALLHAARPGSAIPEAEALDEAPRPPDQPSLGPVVLRGRAAPELDAAQSDAAGCTRCPLAGPATQTVFGEGPGDARLMFVGEQPGDQEDVIGRPFVGPAGQLLDRALEEAGIDRRASYVTNAAKHFKFVPRGTRRIHQKPEAAEIAACGVWLAREREVLRPALIVLLGATAAQAVLGRLVTIGRERGRGFTLPDGQPALITVHPSYLLRLPDAASKAREYAAFVADLRCAAALARDMDARSP
jgi:uracil-DNA glycosylase family protein